MSQRACILCRCCLSDTTYYGEMFDNGKWAVHHFCLLFTYNSEQNGNDDEGYQGFLSKDIIKAAKAIKGNLCNYCKKLGANIKCNAGGCNSLFHTNCALKSNCNFQFEGSYPVYCPKHNKISFKEEKLLESECGICYDKLTKSKSILIPCCKNSWFHRRCLQKYAFTSGFYHFKCPLCANKDKCIEELPKMGIFIPVRDAQWELDNDFADIIEPPVVTCEFCDSSEDSGVDYLWKMCDMCGHSGVHWVCLQFTESQNFVCQSCNRILEKTKQEKPKTPRKQKKLDKPVFFLAPDEELCSSDDENVKDKQSNINQPSTSKFMMENMSTDGENTVSSPESNSEILEKQSNQEMPKTPRKEKKLAKPIFFLASDEEVLSSDDESVENKQSNSYQASTSESEKENKIKDNQSKNESDSTDEEIIKPKKINRKIILSDSDGSDDEILPPLRKKMRVFSSPKSKYENMARDYQNKSSKTQKSRYSHRS